MLFFASGVVSNSWCSLAYWCVILSFAPTNTWHFPECLLSFLRFLQGYQLKTIRATLIQCEWSEVAQSCPTLCDPMDSNIPGSAVRGIFQARILEWSTISFSRGSSQPRDQIWVSYIADRRFTIWATLS